MQNFEIDIPAEPVAAPPESLVYVLVLALSREISNCYFRSFGIRKDQRVYCEDPFRVASQRTRESNRGL